MGGDGVCVSFFDLTAFDNFVRLMLNNLHIPPTPATPPPPLLKQKLPSVIPLIFGALGDVHIFVLWEVHSAQLEEKGEGC